MDNKGLSYLMSCRKTEDKVVTFAFSLNHFQSLQNAVASLNRLSWQCRTPNLRQNWVTQSSCHNRLNDDNISHTRGPGTRNLMVICFKNSHSLAATAAPLTYNCMSPDLKHHFTLRWVYKLQLSSHYKFEEEFTSNMWSCMLSFLFTQSLVW